MWCGDIQIPPCVVRLRITCTMQYHLIACLSMSWKWISSWRCVQILSKNILKSRSLVSLASKDMMTNVSFKAVVWFALCGRLVGGSSWEPCLRFKVCYFMSDAFMNQQLAFAGKWFTTFIARITEWLALNGFLYA